VVAPSELTPSLSPSLGCREGYGQLGASWWALGRKQMRLLPRWWAAARGSHPRTCTCSESYSSSTGCRWDTRDRSVVCECDIACTPLCDDGACGLVLGHSHLEHPLFCSIFKMVRIYNLRPREVVRGRRVPRPRSSKCGKYARHIFFLFLVFHFTCYSDVSHECMYIKRY
jgi:hypothetical protein